MAHKPDVFVLSDRPSFTENGKTDASEYGYWVWGPGTTGIWRPL
jgi:hypothetical protein